MNQAHQGDPCEHCGKPHDEVNAGPCPGAKQRFGFTMVAVESSNVEAIGYDQTTNRMAVKFHAGGFYVYGEKGGDVLGAIYTDLLRAKEKPGGSVGRSLQIITRNASKFPILDRHTHLEYNGIRE